MINPQLASYQNEMIGRSLQSKLFLEGMAGSGKTTVGIEHMLNMLEQGVPANAILVLVPQRTLALPYQSAISHFERSPGGQVSMMTVGGMARRMVDLFWPVVAEEIGVAHPERPPSFLTLETGLYYMAHLVRPLLDQGLFDSVTIERNRLYSQILDNLNKSAIVGFPFTEIGSRLRSAWIDDTAQIHVVEDAQHCATLFRTYCLQNNLLDFSLQIEIFNKFLWPNPICRNLIKNKYHHLVYDNLEEDTPTAHDIVRDWLPELDTALLIYDQEAGYRKFLGADPEYGHGLVNVCDEYHIFTESFVAAPELLSFGTQMGKALERTTIQKFIPLRSDELSKVINFPDRTLRFYPQMLDWIIDSVSHLIENGTSPGEIVLLAPILPDSLRYALSSRLETHGIPFRSHRPSRSLRDEPVTQTLLTLAALAHPDWGIHPSNFELAYALLQTIEGLDLVRSQILVEYAYRPTQAKLRLTSFEKIQPETRERITYTIGGRYELLRNWLEDYNQNPVQEIDIFFSRLFGEVLSQPGFAFHSNMNAGTIVQNLIESAQKFRWSVIDQMRLPEDSNQEPNPPGKEYLMMIQEGILAAQYIQSWQIPAGNSVLIAPAYTFLLSNQPVDYQFWVDASSTAWSERLYQPLTHPIILSRGWMQGQAWTDVDEHEYNRDSLYKLILGLVRRCRKSIFLGLSDLGEGGFEARGMLLRAIQTIMHQSRGYIR